MNTITVISANVEVEVESGKTCLAAEEFWINELEMEADSEAINPTRNRKRINSKSEEVNSEK